MTTTIPYKNIQVSSFSTKLVSNQLIAVSYGDTLMVALPQGACSILLS